MDSEIDNLKFEIDKLKHAYIDLKAEINLLVNDKLSANITRKRGALATSGVTCESLLKVVYKKEGFEKGGRPAATLMLEDLIQKLASILPAHVMINVRNIQAWRNMGAHDKGDFREIDDFTISQVEQSLNSVVNWFFAVYFNEELAPIQNQNVVNEIKNSTNSVNINIEGFYKSIDEPIIIEMQGTEGKIEIKLFNDAYSFLPNGTFTWCSRYRITGKDKDGSDLSILEFLKSAFGNWEINEKYLTFKINTSLWEPEPQNIQIAKVLEKFDQSKISIYKIISFENDTLTIVSDSTTDAEIDSEHYKKLTNNHKIVFDEENKNWVKSITEKEQEFNPLDTADWSYWGGHIDDYTEFVSLTKAYFHSSNCYYRDHGLVPYLVPYAQAFSIPFEISKDFRIICRYFKEGGFFSKEYELIIGAYCSSENPDHLLSNLVFIRSDKKIFMYSLSLWPADIADEFDFPLPRIEEINLHDDDIMINSYCNTSDENYKDTINIHRDVKNPLIDLYNEIQSRTMEH
jgi:hypothetical protein